MSFLLALLPALLVLGLLIVIHEWGHFIACRLTGVKVEKFSIGFGPEILHWQGKETRFTLSLFPIGGFVKPAGESVSEIEGAQPKPGDYLAAPLLSRIFIVVSGVLMNYVLAFVLFFLVLIMGKPMPGTTVGTFVDGFPAAQSSLKKGDKIVAIDGHIVQHWLDLTQALDAAPNDEVTLSVLRPEGPAEVKITPKVLEGKDLFGKPMRSKKLGISPDPADYTIHKAAFLPAIKEAAESVVSLTALTYQAFYYLIQFKLSMKAVSGPVGIITMTGDAAKRGWAPLLLLAANLSVSLAVFNLLPFPALDGGHLVFLLIEGIRRKPLSLKTQEVATQIGFLILLGLMVFMVMNDMINYHYFDSIRKFFRF